MALLFCISHRSVDVEKIPSTLLQSPEANSDNRDLFSNESAIELRVKQINDRKEGKGKKIKKKSFFDSLSCIQVTRKIFRHKVFGRAQKLRRQTEKKIKIFRSKKAIFWKSKK